MYSGNSALSINDVVSVGLTCLEQHIDSKAEVKERILTAVYSQFNSQAKEAEEVEELPLSVFTLLYEKLGIGFEINDGKLVGVNFNTPAVDIKIINIQGGYNNGKNKNQGSSRS